ncbi:TetR/AcrR family transcriptional regulator [Marinibactrum halimedae]|uniref:TetR family transcriptional regulator n=1 Tax=Marinibactrum halimedae TaxID=1444977 RepID=A0AA37WMN4_9GAMM|nr:TetR/AcrR family transcriptional regulator [Marinibactrum halimedae]MCD9460079.1 TetR/AcrR family transcriptional regulator [Marinibactrum halimedae]GLS26480.1 TetR family transcriptional regulator [Marinibactrum halimedae]
MRSAEFDREEVLRSAMEAFLAKGYGKTSMTDLKHATGLHPGSIYCAFENKRGLLLASLEQYKLDRSHEFEYFFKQEDSVLNGLRSYLAQVVKECDRDNIKDCLLQKALSELAQQDEEVELVIAESLGQWQKGIEDKLLQAQQNNELTTDRNHRELAQFLVMGIYGLRTFSHTQPEKGVLQRLANELFDYISQ